MPTSRPAWSTTGPPETSGTSGESSATPVRGSGNSGDTAGGTVVVRTGMLASAAAGASWRRPIERRS
jgi:hypothetical protein